MNIRADNYTALCRHLDINSLTLHPSAMVKRYHYPILQRENRNNLEGKNLSKNTQLIKGGARIQSWIDHGRKYSPRSRVRRRLGMANAGLRNLDSFLS